MGWYRDIELLGRRTYSGFAIIMMAVLCWWFFPLPQGCIKILENCSF